jgi:SAM-dependent methyltransferase
LNSLYLASLGWVVDAVDFSPLAIRLAHRRAGASADAVHFMVGDAAKLGSLPLRKPYNLILDIGCLHSLGNEQAARSYAESIPAMLKAGGDFLLYAHMPAPAAEEYPSHGLDLEWVKKLFIPELVLTEYKPGEELEQRPARKSAWYYLSKQ